MTLADYGSLLRRQWLTIVAACLLMTAAAAGITLAMPATYAATASSFVSIAATGASSRSNTALYQGSQFALARVKSYPQLAQSPDVLEPVIHDLGLTVSTDQLAKHVSGNNPLDTVYVDITATSPSASQAQALANAVSRQLAIVVQRLETPKGGGAAPVTVTTAVPASLPLAPVSPRKALNLALGFVLGLAIGLIVAVIRRQRDTTVTADDVLALTGRPPLAVLPDAVGARSSATTLAYQGGSSPYRRLSAVLRAGNTGSGTRVLVVTTPRHDEAKTTVARNLALALAESGKRVACVDADPSGPGLAGYPGQQDGAGLAEAITGPSDRLKVLAPTSENTVSMILRGADLQTALSRPGALERLTSLLTSLKRDYDYVVVNASALVPQGDAVVLAAMADGTLVVARHGFTRQADLAAAREELDLVGARWLGTVLTSVPPIGARPRRAPSSLGEAALSGDTEQRRSPLMTGFEHVDVEVQAG